MRPQKALSFVEIDGIRIVTGIADPLPDPEATLETARLAIAAHGYRDRLEELIARGKEIPPESRAEIDELKADVARYALEHQIAVRDYARRNPVYFPHVPGEMLIDPDRAKDFADKIKNLKPNERLTTDGSVVTDDRGKTYYWRRDGVWKSKKIDSITEVKPNGCTWEKDLSDEQLGEIREQNEEQRINTLSLTERRIQAALEIEMAAKDCANLRSTLEIKGDDEALTKARRQFEMLKADIIERYKLEVETNVGQKDRDRQTNDRNGSPHKGRDD